MKKKRLRILHDYLDLVPEERFNMNTWVAGSIDQLNLKAEPTCGTAACAAGWATTIPELAEKGLTIHGSEKYGASTYEPRFRGLDGFEALGAFFGLNEEQSGEIFTPNVDGNSIPEVQRRIRDVIREDKS